MVCFLSTLLIYIGGYALICYLYEHLRTPLRLLWLRLRTSDGKGDDKVSLKERYGDWAAVTGSSDGIGKAYAKQLAIEGLNVVLIARNEQKLQGVANEIERECKVKTKIVIADFTHGAKVIEHIESELDQVPLGILVNNVGITSTKAVGPLTRSDAEEVRNILDTNVMAVSQLSRYFLQRMQRQKSKGALVNVSSGTESQSFPFVALYAASKAYIKSLTLSLKWEAKERGILVQLLSPHFVVTKINNYSAFIMRGGLFIPSADDYARSAVAQLKAGVDETPGYLWHHVQNAVMTLLPSRLRTAIIYYFVTFGKSKKSK